MSLNAVLLAVTEGFESIFEEIFEEDENHGNILEKIEGFAEETVPRFENHQFKRHFRMYPTTFEDLLTKLHGVSVNRFGAVGHPEITLEKQAMIAIWCLSNLESFRSVADRFGITKSSCWDVLYRICKKFLKINSIHKIISWPSRQRAHVIMEAFKEINGFEGVIGCIDGSHIRILPPREHPNSYVNRKGFHSVLLQGVCDNRKLFTHVYVGEPGSIHDSRLFEKSDLFESIESGEYEFPNNAHILGDLAYKLSDYMMVGFKNNNNLTNRQKNFNAKLSQVRVCIENTFGLLKGRFRRIKFLETVRMDLICLLVFSACLLHNICVLNGDGIDDLIDVNQEVEEERDQNEENEFIFVNTRQNQPAIAKRLRIMSELQID